MLVAKGHTSQLGWAKHGLIVVINTRVKEMRRRWALLYVSLFAILDSEVCMY
jgi:hypothetical protein